MNKLVYDKIDEVLFHEQLDNGLNVYLIQMSGFSKSYVKFSTKFGSLEEQIYNDDETIDLPHGIAHFLEHKLFEQNGVDVSTTFALQQANVNAYTQNNRTTYLFSCTDHLHKNISDLLYFVQNPKFSEEGIAGKKFSIEVYDDFLHKFLKSEDDRKEKDFYVRDTKGKYKLQNGEQIEDHNSYSKKCKKNG